MERDNLVWHNGLVTRADRQRLNNHGSGLVWLTGLSGSGKSTVAHAVEKKLLDIGVRAYVLDGDNIRHGLNANLGFSPGDRRENIRRVAEVSRLMVDAGLIVISAFISPYRADRDAVRSVFRDGDFLEVYVRCSLAECERRDPKGQYKKARAGLIRQYTGIDAPYEEPDSPSLVLDTEGCTIEETVKRLFDLLLNRQLVGSQAGSGAFAPAEGEALQTVTREN